MRDAAAILVLAPRGLGITNAFLLLVILRSLTVGERRLKLRGNGYSEGPFGHNKVDETAWIRRKKLKNFHAQD